MTTPKNSLSVDIRQSNMPYLSLGGFMLHYVDHKGVWYCHCADLFSFLAAALGVTLGSQKTCENKRAYVKKKCREHGECLHVARYYRDITCSEMLPCRQVVAADFIPFKRGLDCFAGTTNNDNDSSQIYVNLLCFSKTEDDTSFGFCFQPGGVRTPAPSYVSPSAGSGNTMASEADGGASTTYSDIDSIETLMKAVDNELEEICQRYQAEYGSYDETSNDPSLRDVANLLLLFR